MIFGITVDLLSNELLNIFPEKNDSAIAPDEKIMQDVFCQLNPKCRISYPTVQRKAALSRCHIYKNACFKIYCLKLMVETVAQTNGWGGGLNSWFTLLLKLMVDAIAQLIYCSKHIYPLVFNM